MFAQWLRQFREARGWSQTELARHLGVSLAYYNSLENANKTATRRKLYDIAQKLGDVRIIAQLFGKDVLERFQREHEARMVLATSHPDSPYEEVPIDPLLMWWGFSPRARVRLMRYSEWKREPFHGQLFYVTEGPLEEGSFYFANLQERTPQLESVASVLIRYFDLACDREMQLLDLDLSQMKKIPLYEGVRRLYVAIQVYESLDDAEEVHRRFTPLMTPRIRNLDVHAKRQVNLLAGYLSAVQAASPPPHAATGETSETLEPFVATP
ncbi:helix-turn-helix domain-containing protein [Alicyclobacillus acidocaldarius]|nr:helix-turn-helix transcriptional regulator [Alicyclobacillus acidocaldarius]